MVALVGRGPPCSFGQNSITACNFGRGLCWPVGCPPVSQRKVARIDRAWRSSLRSRWSAVHFAETCEYCYCYAMGLLQYRTGTANPSSLCRPQTAQALAQSVFIGNNYRGDAKCLTLQFGQKQKRCGDARSTLMEEDSCGRRPAHVCLIEVYPRISLTKLTTTCHQGTT